MENESKIPEVGPRPLMAWIFEPDELLGWRMAPNRKGWYSKGSEFRTLIRTNRWGCRGANFEIEKPDGIRRILLLADSFGAGLEIEEDQIFPRILELELNQAGGNYEVINLSVGGYGTEQELIWLQKYGKTYAPDLILVAFHYGDDLVENSHELSQAVAWRLVKLPRPHLEGETPDSLHLVNYPPPHKTVRRSWQRYYDMLPPRLWQELKPASHPWKVEIFYRLRRRVIEILRNRIDKIKRRVTTPVDLLMYQLEPDPRVEKAWRHTENVLAVMKKEAESLQATLLVVGIPTKEQIVPGFLESRLQGSFTNPIGFDRSLPAKRLSEIVSRQNIQYLDLIPEFLAQQSAGNQLFFKGDLHWNGSAHLLGGKRIAAWIAAKELQKAI